MFPLQINATLGASAAALILSPMRSVRSAPASAITAAANRFLNNVHNKGSAFQEDEEMSESHGDDTSTQAFLELEVRM